MKTSLYQFVAFLVLSVCSLSAAANQEYPNIFCVSRVWVAYTDAQGKENIATAPGANLEFYKGYLAQSVPQHPELLYWVTPMGTYASQNGGKMDYRFSVAADISNNRVVGMGDMANGQAITFGYEDTNYNGFPNKQIDGKPNACKLVNFYAYCASDAAKAQAAADAFFKVNMPVIPNNCGALE